jgi:RNA polymerase sigma-70 factor (ECF subfamily)
LAETFVRALENIGRFRWQGRSILPWLIRIAKNACFDHLRRAGRSAPWSEDLERALACVGDGSGNKMEQIVGAERARQVLRERISQCLEHINPRYRRVLELRLVRGLGREQSAAELEVSLGTLDVLLCRACKAFRAQYLARFAEPSTEFGSP